MYTLTSLWKATYQKIVSCSMLSFAGWTQSGLNVLCVLTHSIGNNKGNFHFVWKCTGSEGGILEKYQTTIEAIKKWLSVFHTWALRKQIQEIFGRLSHMVKPSPQVSLNLQRVHW